MATSSSGVSFQGLSTGLQTDALVNAILAQEGKKVEALTARQTKNNAKTAVLNALKSSMSSVYLSLASLQDKLNSRLVTSTDSNNTNVTATASGAASGNYDLTVTTVATKGRLSPSLNFTGTSSNPLVAFNSASAKTAVGTVGFTIDPSSVPGGAVSGTFTVGGANYVLTGTNGTLSGAVGTPLEGLSVSVTAGGGGSGTISLAAVPTNLAVANPSDAIFSSAKASFAIRGTDGAIKTFELANNSLNGLRDAINTADPNVSATIINTGSGANPYQLIITAKDTGTGTTAGVVTLAAINNADSTPTVINPALGITGGTLTGPFSAPTALAGGLTSTVAGTSATDAVFSLNGIQLTRKTNVVSDAADGVTFTLKRGGQIGTTTLTVAQDKITATAGMQDVITKFNALLKTYKDAATATQDTNGTILPGALTGDATTRTLISQIRSALTGTSPGLPTTATFQNPASLGVKTNADGTLTLNTVTFQMALDKDPAAAMRLYSFTGDSSNAVVAFKGASSKTVTGPVGFTIDSYTAGGAVSGTFTGTNNGTPFSLTLSGTNGTLIGASGTALEGLTVAVSGMGAGTLTLSRGAGQVASDVITNSTAYGTGSISTTLTNIASQNKTLVEQIAAGQSALDARKKVLQAQFSKMEITIGQLKAAGGSLTTM